MAAKPTVKFALEFPQGLILMTDHGTYFHPPKNTGAFQVYGEGKELFGKQAITVREDYTTRDPGYSIVHEFGENGALTDARLIRGKETFRGKLADASIVADLNAKIQSGAITTYTTRDTQAPMVSRAARFADGRMLLMVERDLYLGTPGNYEKLDAQVVLQGGSSLYFKTGDGKRIALPWGMGGPNGELPSFDSEPLNYVSSKSGEEPSKYGLTLPGRAEHLNPFSPQLSAKPAAKQAFKPGGQNL